MQIPQGSGAAAVKVAGHFFNWVGLWVGKKMNAPEGLDLDCRCVRWLVGNCLFLYILFFVYKIFIPIVTGQVGTLAGACAGKGKRMASAIFLRAVGNAM